MAREVVGVAEVAAFEHGVLEIETQLEKEVAEVCRDYCAKVWAESLNWAGVLANSKLRKAENIYFLVDI